MTDESKKDSKELPALYDTSLINALKHFGIAFGGDLMSASNQITSLMPVMGTMFSVLSTQPNTLGMQLEFVQANAIRNRQGTMAMHLRREAHVQYLRDGNEEHLFNTERMIDMLSPYLTNSKVGYGDLPIYLSFILPYLGEYWQIKHLNKDLQNSHVLNLGTFRPLVKDEVLRHEDSTGAVELTYQSETLYKLSVVLRRDPPSAYVNDHRTSESSTTLRFNLNLSDNLHYIATINTDGAPLVKDALERMSYAGSDVHIDIDRFCRLIRAFIGQSHFCSWDRSLIDSADSWLTKGTRPPLQLIQESGYEHLPEGWSDKEGDEKPPLLENNATAQNVFFHPEARPLGEGVPFLRVGHYPYPYLGMGTGGLSCEGDATILTVMEHDGHRLEYAEWNDVRAPVTDDISDEIVTNATNFLLAVDTCIIITGTCPRTSYAAGHWEWCVKAWSRSNGWKPYSVTPPTYTALFNYLRVARDAYADRLNASPLREFVQSKIPSDRWCTADENTRMDLSKQMKELGFTTFNQALSPNGYSPALRKILRVRED